MAWKIREDPEGWECKMPVFKFRSGNGVTTRLGIEDSEGKLRIFLVTLNERGIEGCIEDKNWTTL